MGKSALLSNGKGSNADKVQDSDTSLLVPNKADKTAKEDYLDSVINLSWMYMHDKKRDLL